MNDEAERAGGAGRRQPGDSNEPVDSAENQQRAGGQRGERQPSERQQQGRESADARGGGNRPTDSARDGRQQQGSPRDGSQRQANDRGANRPNADGRADPRGWGGGQRLPNQWGGIYERGPLTGEDFRQWSDRLRDVEEMLDEPDLRNEAARIRDRARSMRVEFKRHGKEPQWNLVRQQITKPLTELRKRIDEELAKLESKEALVPIDRDPVPSRYAELVRRYYENLGGGD
jgi:hypothetical protein